MCRQVKLIWAAVNQELQEWRKNKTKVGQIKTNKEGRLANTQAQKTQVKGTKHDHRRARMWSQ